MAAKNAKSTKVAQAVAKDRRAAESRAKEASVGRGKTPSKTAEPSKTKTQPEARPRNAKKTNATVQSGESSDTQGKAAYELEASNPAKRPSRKSTRGSANRQKPDSQLKRRATRKTRSPQARSQSRSG
jgi:hypothetical protein